MRSKLTKTSLSQLLSTPRFVRMKKPMRTWSRQKEPLLHWAALLKANRWPHWNGVMHFSSMQGATASIRRKTNNRPFSLTWLTTTAKSMESSVLGPQLLKSQMPKTLSWIFLLAIKSWTSWSMISSSPKIVPFWWTPPTNTAQYPSAPTTLTWT